MTMLSAHFTRRTTKMMAPAQNTRYPTRVLSTAAAAAAKSTTNIHRIPRTQPNNKTANSFGQTPFRMQQQQQHIRRFELARMKMSQQEELRMPSLDLPNHVNLAILQEYQHGQVLNQVNRFPVPVDTKTLLQAAYSTFEHRRDQPFIVYDVKALDKQYERWEDNLPGIRAMYAVKCNPDPVLMQTLADRGAGFDCASSMEISQALDTGVPADSIIFANPIKSFEDLEYAKSVNVKRMTFDNLDELHKIKQVFPSAEVVLRLLPDDSGSLMRFGSKFGCPDVMVPQMIDACKDLDLNLVGVSFHIGSGCFDPTKYDSALKQCRKAFDYASVAGLPPLQLVDVGGGFPGSTIEDDAMRAASSDNGELQDVVPSFEVFSGVIRQAFQNYFPREEFPNLEKIGEPGRYFATSWGTLFALVQGKREQPKDYSGDANGADRAFLYYINDGVYGSFNSIIFDHFHPSFEVASNYFSDVEETTSSTEVHDITIFGPTCDSMDVVVQNGKTDREIQVGDWLLFKNMGAYTTAAGSRFNGCKRPENLYFSSY